MLNIITCFLQTICDYSDDGKSNREYDDHCWPIGSGGVYDYIKDDDSSISETNGAGQHQCLASMGVWEVLAAQIIG